MRRRLVGDVVEDPWQGMEEKRIKGRSERDALVALFGHCFLLRMEAYFSIYDMDDQAFSRLNSQWSNSSSWTRSRRTE